jgi:glycine/D-amino acid oxidase-like deaminating enzyme
MRVLILCDCVAASAGHIVSDLIHYRPDLQDSSRHEFLSALTEIRPNVIIAQREVEEHALGAWLTAAAPEPVVLMLLRPGNGMPRAREFPSMYPKVPDGLLPNGIPFFEVPWESTRAGADRAGEALLTALAVAERFIHDSITRAGRSSAPGHGTTAPGGNAGSVILIGAGIVNLVTAHELSARAFSVTVLDAGPDPRSSRCWQEYGCSRGGGNARMFTLTEADDYHDQRAGASPSGNDLFDDPPGLLGWDVRSNAPDGDSAWVRDFKRVPPWLARAYNLDIFGLNRRSGELWSAWAARQPELFDDVCVHRDVLRLYENPADLAAGIRRQESVGAVLACYPPDQVRRLFPALGEAAPAAFAGGILVRGFTLGVHDFMARLLDGLEAAGARLCFGRRAERVLRNADGEVTGVLTTDGVLGADHYVVSPGAYGGSLLHDTGLPGAIHGVLGCWVTIPNVAPFLENSLKVARSGHIANDANVTVGRDASGEPALVIGSGYGWTGGDPSNIDGLKLRDIHLAVIDTVRRLFPRAFELAGGETVLRRAIRFCVRPWTASNLGIFDAERAATGLFVVTGGHNTGGFAQAPVTAEAVLAAIAGRHHPMHSSYAPRRTERALGPLVPADPSHPGNHRVRS